MAEYTLLIRNDKLKFYNRFGWFIILINILFALYVALTMHPFPALFLVFISLNALVLILQTWFRNSIYKFGLHPYFFIGGMFWMLLDFIPVFSLICLFDLLYIFATKKPVVMVSSDHVSYPSFIYKKTNWIQLNNLLLKDGLLTIDFKNDKVIQQMIDENKTSVDEKEFNEFCRVQLRKSGPGKDERDIGGAIEGLGEIISSIT